MRTAIFLSGVLIALSINEQIVIDRSIGISILAAFFIIIDYIEIKK